MKKKNLSWLLLIVFVMTLSAISIGACGSSGGGGGESESDTNDNGNDGGDGDNGASGSSHNAGLNCGQSGCHSGAVEADKRYTYAGTVYTDITGTTAARGVTVVITDSTGTLNLVTDQSGNFYTTQGSPTAGYSATVQGNSVAMVTRPGTGSCASAGCHGSGTAVIYQN